MLFNLASSIRRFVSFIGFAIIFLIAQQISFGQVVINEIYGGGGNAGAPYTHDYIELYNTGSTSVSLPPSTLQYQAQGGPTWSVIATTTGANIPANGYYLVQFFSQGPVGVSLPTPDLIGGTTNISASAAKIVLVNSTTALASGCPASYVDLVGYGITSVFCNEDSNAPAPSNTNAIQRNPEGSDTNVNSVDFVAQSPTPRNSGMTPPTITEIPDQIIPVSGTTGILNFTVGDLTDVPGTLVVTGASSNTTLIPVGNIIFGGSGANRTVTVTPVAGLSGEATITITVTDSTGLTATYVFGVIVTNTPPPTCLPGTPLNLSSNSSVALDSSITVYSSNEESQNTPAGRATVDTLDDSWRTASQTAGLGSFNTPWTGGAASSSLGSSPFSLFTHVGITVSVQLRNMNGLEDVAGGPCSGGSSGTAGLSINGSTGMQDNSPYPASLYPPNSFWNEIAGSPNTRNAAVFTFSSPVKSFGAWFGDLESRTDGNGKPAIIRLLDSTGARIGEDIRLVPSLQGDANCGGTNPTDSLSNCGNESTRWIGFVDSSSNSFAPVAARVSSLIVIVGDDDDPLDVGTSDGKTEHLSFIGPQIGSLAPTAASVSISGRVISRSIRGSRNVLVALSDQDGFTRYTQTNQFGYFRFKEIAIGNHILNAYSKGRQYDSQVITVNDNLDSIVINEK